MGIHLEFKLYLTRKDEEQYARKQASAAQKDKVVMMQCLIIRIEEYYLY